MHGKITIEEPFLFYSHGDEKAFFFWLDLISSIKNYKGVSDGLELEVETPIDDVSLKNLIGLFCRYNLNMMKLSILEHDGNRHWFRNTEKFWYNKIWPHNE